MPTKLLTAEGQPLQGSVDLIPIGLGDASYTLLTFGPPHLFALPRSAPTSDLSWLDPRLGASMLEVMPEAMLIQDMDTVLFVNALAREYMCAADWCDIEGRPILSFVHRDGLISAIERVAFVFATHQRVHGVPLKLQTVTGSVIHALGDAYPMRVNGHWGALIVGQFLREGDI